MHLRPSAGRSLEAVSYCVLRAGVFLKLVLKNLGLPLYVPLRHAPQNRIVLFFRHLCSCCIQPYSKTSPITWRSSLKRLSAKFCILSYRYIETIHILIELNISGFNSIALSGQTGKKKTTRGLFFLYIVGLYNVWRLLLSDLE